MRLEPRRAARSRAAAGSAQPPAITTTTTTTTMTAAAAMMTTTTTTTSLAADSLVLRYPSAEPARVHFGHPLPWAPPTAEPFLARPRRRRRAQCSEQIARMVEGSQRPAGWLWRIWLRAAAACCLAMPALAAVQALWYQLMLIPVVLSDSASEVMVRLFVFGTWQLGITPFFLAFHCDT